MRRVLGDRQVVLPDDGAFLGNPVGDLIRFVGLACLIGGHAGVAVVGQCQAKTAVGQIIDLPAAGDVQHRRLQLMQQRLGSVEIVFVGAVGILAQVVQRQADDLLR
ncbi:hypothetical protein D3C76_1225530 [compost metagenome]